MNEIEIKKVDNHLPVFDCLNMTEEERKKHDEVVDGFEAGEDEEHALNNFYICGAEKNYLKEVDFENYIIVENNKRQSVLLSLAKTMVDKIKNGQYINLVLLGSPGVGKTFTALCILKEVCRMTYIESRVESSSIMKEHYPFYDLKRWYTGLYLTSDDLNNKLHEAESYSAKINRSKIIKFYTTCKLLIIDEIGRTSTKKEKDNLFTIVDKRHQNGLPTIFISNMNQQAFIDSLGNALADRILSSKLYWEDGNQAINMRQFKSTGTY